LPPIFPRTRSLRLPFSNIYIYIYIYHSLGLALSLSPYNSLKIFFYFFLMCRHFL
jgi:hypothetical protein